MCAKVTNLFVEVAFACLSPAAISTVRIDEKGSIRVKIRVSDGFRIAYSL